MLQTWNPWQELEDVQRRLSRAARSSGPVTLTPATDIVEDKDGLTLYVDLPNLDEGSLDVSLEGNRLNVRATRRAPNGEGKRVHYQGRPSGTYAGTFRVPASFDLGKVSASYDSGVLTLVVPHAESARPRKIEVASGRAQEENVTLEAAPEENNQDAQYA